MAWFSKVAPGPRGPVETKVKLPEGGLWERCPSCNEIVYKDEREKNFQVCPRCTHHYRASARQRLLWTCDAASFVEHDANLAPSDPLDFKDSKRYRDRIKASRKAGPEGEAFVGGMGKIQGIPVSIGAFEFSFMGGSMGSVVGEKVARLFDRGREHTCPVILFCASGGARMQEGILSLMQMAKTTAALAAFRGVKQPYIPILTDPTTGGVAASFAMQGDVSIAEPKALVGFAGPRVIEQTIRQKLPEGFQRSEFLLQHGMLDLIVPRPELPATLARLIRLLVN
ncbi:MAG: acetyl-CoA carboxylase, carboxyltransferase subunit beta [Pseudomonadota bacterium]